MKTKGCVFDSERSLVEPDELYDRSRYEHTCTSLTPGSEPNWIQLLSGLWVMDFDGTDDYVEVPDAISLNFGTHDFTAVVWLYPDSISKSNAVWLSKTDGWAVGVTNAGILCNLEIGYIDFELIDGAARNRSKTGTKLNLSTWNHVVCIRKEAGGGSVEIYQDVTLQSLTQDLGVNFDANVDNTIAMRFGYDNHADRKYGGDMCGLRFFNYALSATQIRKIFDAERDLFGV